MKAALSLLTAALALAGITAASADDAPDASGSVAVTTVPAHQGGLPRRVIAYGMAGPAPGASVTLNLQQDGRVEALDVAAGQNVRTGTPLLQFAASASAASTFNQAVTALALANSQRAHTRQLLSQQLATRDQLAQAEKAVTDAQATLTALQRQGAATAAQTLTAPFDGVVTSVAVAQGDRVVAGAPLLVLTRQNGVVIQVGLEPDLVGLVHHGQPVLLQSLDQAADAAGQIDWVGGALDPKSRLLNAAVAVPAGGVLVGGAYRAAITVGAWQGWIVPHEAVLSGPDGFYLFQRDADKARRVAVQVLGTDAASGAQAQDVVSGALNPTRPIILDGASQLDDGDSVRDPARAAADTAREAK